MQVSKSEVIDLLRGCRRLCLSVEEVLGDQRIAVQPAVASEARKVERLCVRMIAKIEQRGLFET